VPDERATYLEVPVLLIPISGIGDLHDDTALYVCRALFGIAQRTSPSRATADSLRVRGALLDVKHK
jgi:hypothetical protein